MSLRTLTLPSAQQVLDRRHPPASPPPSAPPAAPGLREAFRSAVASTWVVTSAGPDGPVGFTAISVVSVSLQPPLVSFNIARTSSSLATIRSSGRVGLHLLATDQSALAGRFAGDRSQRFVDDGAWDADAEGLPRLHGVSARLVAAVTDLVEAGDSLLALARVETVSSGTRPPLAHHGGRFLPLARTVGS